jgi:hypothetical protein
MVRDPVHSIITLTAFLAGRTTKFGYRGEKPVAILAMLRAMKELKIRGLKGTDLLNDHKRMVKIYYIALGREVRTVDSGNWSVITSGDNSEMYRALLEDPDGNEAFAGLSEENIDEIIQWFHEKLRVPDEGSPLHGRRAPNGVLNDLQSSRASS